MRVLLDCRMATWSGVGRYSTGLAQALAARSDIELVQVCAQSASLAATHCPGSDVLVAAAHPFGIRGALELGRLARETRPDIIHCLHFPTPARPCAPLVVTLHDLTPLLVPRVMPSAVKRVVYRRWNARAARLADTLLVPSLSTAEDASGFFPEAREKLVVTPEAADDFSSGPSDPLTEPLARLASSPYLLSMGNTKPHKDLPTLLKAFGRLVLAKPGLRLVLVGAEPPGYLDEKLDGVAAEVRSRVAFTGRVSDAELRTLYAGASVFVFPSRYEGFGLPVLEAMAFGAPVVCADAASLPEVAGDAALLFPAGDPSALSEALARILGGPELRHRLVEAGRDRVREFTWEHTAAATVAAYSEAIRHFAVRHKRRSDPG